MGEANPQIVIIAGPKDHVTFSRINFAEQAEAIERILQAAVRETLSMHKRLGNSIAVWKDGKVVIVPPEEIVISPDPINPDD